MREAEEALAKLAVNLTIEGVVAKAFRDLSKALESMAIKWIKAMEEATRLTGSWQLLDPRYLRLHSHRNEWPDVIYEDILDADEIG
jgi:hypothetical protein